MLTSLNQFLTKHSIRDGTLLIGVSGGADSVALLRALHAVADHFRLNLIAAHFDHAIRNDSADDARWVANLASRLQIPIITERRKGDPSQSLPSEESARVWRYRFFRKCAREFSCQWVAVAHTADDQAETVIHHIIRGSGLKGLSGIPPVRLLFSDTEETGEPTGTPPLLIRPLLNVPRRELLAYLSGLGQDFRTDPTNVDCQYTRNRIRRELLPLIREQYNAQINDALTRLAVQSGEAQQLIEELASQLFGQLTIEQRPERIRLRRETGSSLQPVLLREMFRQIWEKQNWPRQGLGFSHLETLANMFSTGTPRNLSLPGFIEAVCRRQVLELRRSPSDSLKDS